MSLHERGMVLRLPGPWKASAAGGAFDHLMVEAAAQELEWTAAKRLRLPVCIGSMAGVERKKREVLQGGSRGHSQSPARHQSRSRSVDHGRRKEFRKSSIGWVVVCYPLSIRCKLKYLPALCWPCN